MVHNIMWFGEQLSPSVTFLFIKNTVYGGFYYLWIYFNLSPTNLSAPQVQQELNSSSSVILNRIYKTGF